jgi:hypothetical protein
MGRLLAEAIEEGRDIAIIGSAFFFVALALYLDASASLSMQNTMGFCAWFFLGLMLLGESTAVRMQVVVAIAFATVGEYFASVYLGAYIYRFENVPAYVPPGHGMVYLTAVVMARQALFTVYRQQITWLVLAIGGVWSLWGLFFAERGDAGGALLFAIFVYCLYKGRSPLVYLGAFFITTWLEVVGTWSGTWYWAVYDPVLGLPQGNPPSGVAVWYVMVDALALALAPRLVLFMRRVRRRLFKRKALPPQIS